MGDRFGGLARLMAPRSVAVIGASADPSRIGGRPIAYMREGGFSGVILPVNPNRAEVQGLRAYPSIAALPEAPDVAIVAVPAEGAIAAVAAWQHAAPRPQSCSAPASPRPGKRGRRRRHGC